MFAHRAAIRRLVVLVAAAIAGCEPAQPAGQVEAIRRLQQLVNARGEHPHVERDAAGRIRVVIPFNDGRGGGWNDEEFAAGVACLKDVPQLHRLDMQLTKITDEGVARLEQLPQVRILHLDGTEITDQGLSTLAKLTQLEELSVESHHITRAGVRELRRQLPRTKVKAPWND